MRPQIVPGAGCRLGQVSVSAVAAITESAAMIVVTPGKRLKARDIPIARNGKHGMRKRGPGERPP